MKLLKYYSFKYNQQDALLYNIFIIVNAVHVSGGFTVKSSGAQKLYTQHRVYAKLGIYLMLCLQFLSS